MLQTYLAAIGQDSKLILSEGLVQGFTRSTTEQCRIVSSGYIAANHYPRYNYL